MSLLEARRFVDQVINDPERAKGAGLPDMTFHQIVAHAAEKEFDFSHRELVSVLGLYLRHELSLPRWLASRVESEGNSQPQ